MEINQVKFAKVVEAAKARAAGNARWIAAIEKAVAGIAGGWIVTELADGIMVTTESGQTYHANGKHCQCRAFELNQPCKHRGLCRLLALYNEEATKLDVSTRGRVARSTEREFNAKTGKPGKRIQVVRIDGMCV